MEPDRSQRLERAFAATIALPLAQRQRALDALAGEDPELRAQLERMLDAHEPRTVDARVADANRGSATALPATIGRFRVLGEIARGGIGIVLRAEDPTIGRQVAVKVLRPEYEEHEFARRLLAEEGRLGGRLQHPSIVPVYEIGVADHGRPYLAMRVVEGRDFATMLAERAAPLDQRARMLSVFEQICQAIAYAHRCGVVHRDLKPGNVMVGAFGEVQVMDWGIALQLEPDGAAPPHRLSGTPPYMAPEQARGDGDRVDPRSDVFGLGAILCEILTGQPPYGGGTSTELLARAREARLDGAREALRAVRAGDGDLVRLALACLDERPAARPADGAAVAAAVHGYLESAAERLRNAELETRAAQARAASERTVRRRTVALALVVAATAIGGAWTWMHGEQRAHAAERRLSSALLEAERRRATAEAPPGNDAQLWDAALQAARSAAALVDADVPAAPAARAAELLQQATALADDLRFCGELSAAGSETTCTNRLDRRPMADDLRRRFAARTGSPVEDTDPRAVAAALASIRWREQLVQALDTWLRIEREIAPRSPHVQHVRAIADGLDADAWRTRVRAAACANAGATLRQLADDPLAEQAAAPTLRQLGLALMQVGDATTAVATLRRCVERFPSDFESMLDLSWTMIDSNTSPADAALRYVQAALALQPQNPSALELLAMALGRCGRFDDALATIDAVVARSPTPSFRHSRAQLRRDAGDLAGAADDFAAVLAAVDPTHNGWPLLQLQLAAVCSQQGDAASTWQHYRRGATAPNMRAAFLDVTASGFERAEVAAIAREHVGDADAAWAAWLLLGVALRREPSADTLAAFERVADAPAWANRYAALEVTALRTRLGAGAMTFRTAARAVQQLPPDVGLDDARSRLAPTFAALRAAGRVAIAEHLDGLLCERAQQPAAALPRYRAAIAADRDAAEPWLRLHACRTAVDGADAADAEIRDLLAAGRPGAILRLPLRAPHARLEATTAGLVELTWTRPAPVDERDEPAAVHVRVRDDADPHEAHAALDLWLPGASSRLELPPYLLARGRAWSARVRVLGRSPAPASPWSDAVDVGAAARADALPLDLSPWANADVVADPRDAGANRAPGAFDSKNDFRLLVDGFDGARTGVAAANGLPADGRLGVFQIGAYDRPQTIQMAKRAEPLRIDLPPGRYSGMHLLAAAANGAARVPIAIAYDDAAPGEERTVTFADWFDASSPAGLGLEAIGSPAVWGMDRIGRDGFEQRDAARLFDRVVPLDPERVARSVTFLLDRASGAEPQTAANLLAVTLMRAVAPGPGR